MNNYRLKEMLRQHEGLRLKRYRCTAGHWTIGYGWNLDAHALPGEMASYERVNQRITKEMAEELLEISANAAIRDAQEIYPALNTYSEARQCALADFVFNVGAGTALKFKNTNKAIYEGRWNDAARGFENSLWFKQVGGRAVKIVQMIREG
ncbi:MAG: glycoside hydrolase family protein [Thermoplasmata archaeon]|nr:glycoside hydrolase family protein [Thermoplasmata archaeon]